MEDYNKKLIKDWGKFSILHKYQNIWYSWYLCKIFAEFNYELSILETILIFNEQSCQWNFQNLNFGKGGLQKKRVN